MKLNYNFEIIKLDDDNITAVPVGENSFNLHGVLKINDVSANILEILKTTTDYESVKAKFIELYKNQNENEVVEVLDEFLATLQKEGILEK